MGDKMKALITGATSGIGLDMAKILYNKGYDLILVGRNTDKLNKEDFKENVKIISLDLSDINNCYKLYEETKNEDIDVFINNAGFGLFGNFTDTSLEEEINMINTNVIAVHILTKLFLQDMIKKDKGYILNTASAAAYSYGPLMATYYSTKSYVYKLTLSIYEELKKKKSNVVISCLTPGPVDTNFNNVAKVHFTVKSLSSEYVANYAIEKLFKKKLLIVPGFGIKLSRIFVNLLPLKLILKISYGIQEGKNS